MKSVPRVASIRGGQKKEKVICLDLDNTLLVSHSYQPIGKSFKVQIPKTNGQQLNIYVMKRPGFDEFINTLAEVFTIVIFTASEQRYSEPVIEALMPYIPKENRFYRGNCIKIKNHYVKDLKIIGIPLKSVFIIDDIPESFLLQPQNGLLIEKWFGSPDDDQLLKILPQIIKLQFVDDVRKCINSKINVY